MGGKDLLMKNVDSSYGQEWNLNPQESRKGSVFKHRYEPSKGDEIQSDVAERAEACSSGPSGGVLHVGDGVQAEAEENETGNSQRDF